jgi:hypothetical protein
VRDELFFRIITDQYLYNSFIQAIGITECLSTNQKNLYQKVTQFADRNSRCLTQPEAETLFDKAFDVSKISTEFTFEFVLNEVRREKMKYWILNVAENIEQDRVDYDKVYKDLSLLKDKLELHIPKGIVAGSLIGETVELESGKLKTDVMKSGINTLDYVLRGGFHKSEIAFLIAPPGRGKSTFLVNLMYSFLIQKRVTLLLSNELRAESILSRLYRRVLKMPREDFVVDNKQKIEKDLGTYFKYIKGKGVIHYVPVTSWGVSDVKAWVTAWEKQLGVPVDALIIDYADRLKKPWGEDNRLKVRALVDELRDYAVEKDIFIGTATQSNRSGLSASVVTEEHVSDSFAKVESADVVLSLSQSAQERDNQRSRLTLLKNREYGSAGSVVDVRTNWELLTIEAYDHG